ncbi:MAG: RidA family protein [Rhodospirillales bacterium]|nr:RidA family protein [Rhodospirillales bacterium]
MSGKIEMRLTELGIELPEVTPAVGNYVPWVLSGNLVFISGQLSLKDGKPQFQGRLGENLGTEDGQRAARACGLNLIAQLRQACEGDLDRVARIIRLGGHVNCTPKFTEHPQVINGASDLMVEIFGALGRHARAAIGCASLPLGEAVEVDGIFELA